jgi:hypothetical protein
VKEEAIRALFAMFYSGKRDFVAARFRIFTVSSRLVSSVSWVPFLRKEKLEAALSRNILMFLLNRAGPKPV